MRRLLFSLMASAVALSASAAFGEDKDCACGPQWKRLTQQSAQVDLVFPPIGYVLDPSDALPSIFIVNQGPVSTGPDVIALPTYSEGGHAYLIPYPNIGRGYVEPYRGFNRPRWRRTQVYRTWGAYAYRPAPSARVITVPPSSGSQRR